MRGTKVKGEKAKIQLYWLLPAFLLVFATLITQAQPTNSKQRKEQLQMQMKKLQDEIKTIEKAIKNNKAKKDKSLSEILSLQAKIKSRENLIGNINNQIGDLDETIDKTREEITSKAGEVEKMKGDYATMLRKSYQNITLQNQVVFLLSSGSFYDAIHRYNYLLKVAEYRKGQAIAIQKAIGELEVKKEDLEENKQEKESLLQKQTAQKKELEVEKKQKDETVAQLLEKEKKLRKTQQDKNAAIAKLNSRIQSIIEEEIRLARKKAEEDAKRSGTATKDVSIKKGTNETMPLTPAEVALSKDFSNNMGKLPWPVVRGHIVGLFGKHSHPVLKGVIIENNGVDIKTETGSEARSVFGGTVVSVFFLPTTHNCVIVKHGEFFTVYSNIETVAVKAGQALTVKQSLGKLYTDKNEDLTKVHLEIWKGKDKLDPKLWLAN
ncbi:MAG: peptidoglycan DD-metalloendopeptidase family protein [Chitinophagales bacterium]|nr:peptidoglycan DD-metalloendopeptidase family protein [Chitinophagales bacterium]